MGSDLAPYVAQLALEWKRRFGRRTHHRLDASLLYADISGFTALSELLSKQGRIGAELLTLHLGSVFRELLTDAERFGGDLLKFGGDSILVLFEGDRHVDRAAAGAIAMQRRLRSMSALEVGGRRTRIRMSAGLHTGEFDFFLAGAARKELFVVGANASKVVTLEQAAASGQVAVSRQVAVALAPAAGGVVHRPRRRHRRRYAPWHA